ncbi:tyrosinase-like protein [Babylonia areolata]|uniref:tyrosinase-like protein n=1 Tax=Babylonia areolata TaxID=304850 RepID=UPI003FD0E760
MSRWALSRVLAVVGVLAVLPVPPYVDPQVPGTIETPDILDSLRLTNILLRRPIGPMSVRRECRLLNATEFERITSVINRAKRDTRIRPNVYDAFAYLHAHPEVNTGAHQGPGFLPFHRVLLFLFEKLMRLYDPTVSLCYWDSTLEPQDMTSSASWTSSLFGNNQGSVLSGFPAGWVTPLGPLIRNGGQVGRPFTQQDIQQVMARNTLGEISFPGGNIESNVEEKHNYVHTFVGGLMGQVETASYDPVFWFHHTYIDCIYEWFRQKQAEKGINPMRDWPSEYGDPAHAPFAAMRLGRLRMIDGGNNFFSEQTFRCLDSVGSCSSQRECGVHMRCDPLRGRCVSDTLAVRSRNPGQINDLGSLLEGFSGLSSIHSLLSSSPARGFNQLFSTPTLSSFGSLLGQQSSSDPAADPSLGSPLSSQQQVGAAASGLSPGLMNRI